MASELRVAVVTGSNKGVGFGVVRALCKQFEGDVILTARNEALGQEAVASLKKEGLNPKFHQLDILDTASMQKLRDFLSQHYGGLDVLVNNAGIAYKQKSTALFEEQADVTMKTNYNGTRNVSDILFPILRPHARVSNVASMVAGMSFRKAGTAIQKRFAAADMTMTHIDALAEEFVRSAKVGDYEDRGWPNSSYGVSKMMVCALSFVQQKELSQDARVDIVVNSCCPGYVNTDMSSGKGTKTIDEGALTPVYLALLPANVESPKGKFVSELQINNWNES